jgi:hypothetical protein
MIMSDVTTQSQEYVLTAADWRLRLVGNSRESIHTDNLQNMTLINAALYIIVKITQDVL